jgi:hypothetical protein
LPILIFLYGWARLGPLPLMHKNRRELPSIHRAHGRRFWRELEGPRSIGEQVRGA